MRRWEYVEGTASKFWETEAEGAVVTVRYGRCGSDGRTQTKEYASAEAAAAQVVRTIAEKEKKGYREVGASASAPAAPDATAPATAPDEVPDEGTPVLPDEDTFTLPAGWKRVLHPRRGGVRRGPVKVRREAFDTIEARLAENAAWIQEFADSPRSDAAVAESLRAHLGTDPSPVGAAALTAIVDAPGWADFWSERYGLPFAARTATEVFSVDADWQQSGLKRGAPRLMALPAPATPTGPGITGRRSTGSARCSPRPTKRPTGPRSRHWPSAAPTPCARSSSPTWCRARPAGWTSSARIPR